ncbi:chromosome partitioning protein ParB, partial [bacterium]|nr:chromosome partitioning protein ParB [bacterium]
VNRLKRVPQIAVKPARQPDLLMSSLEDQLQKQFQTRIAIKRTKAGKGALEIHFNSADELSRIVDLLQS